MLNARTYAVYSNAAHSAKSIRSTGILPVGPTGILPVALPEGDERIVHDYETSAFTRRSPFCHHERSPKDLYYFANETGDDRCEVFQLIGERFLVYARK